MGVRQTAQPIGVAIAALALPPLGSRFGPHEALLFPAGWCALSVDRGASCSCTIRRVRPPAPGRARARSPYRGNLTLVRIHAASALLVHPAVRRRDVHADLPRRRAGLGSGRRRPADLRLPVGRRASAGSASGVWSDRVGSRLRPMRQLAVAAALLMTGLADRRVDGRLVDRHRLRAGRGGHGGRQRAGLRRRSPRWRVRAGPDARSASRTPARTRVAIVVVPVIAAIIEGAELRDRRSCWWRWRPLIAAPITPVRAEKAAGAAIVVTTQCVDRPPARPSAKSPGLLPIFRRDPCAVALLPRGRGSDDSRLLRRAVRCWARCLLSGSLARPAWPRFSSGCECTSPYRRAPWYLMALGQFMWTIGDAIDSWNVDVAHTSQFPSAADGFYLAAYPILGGRARPADPAAPIRSRLRRAARQRDRHRRPRRAVVGAARPADRRRRRTQSLAASAVQLAYPVADILLVGLLIRLLTTPGGRTHVVLAAAEPRSASSCSATRPPTSSRWPRRRPAPSTSSGCAPTSPGGRPRCTRRCDRCRPRRSADRRRSARSGC